MRIVYFIDHLRADGTQRFLQQLGGVMAQPMGKALHYRVARFYCEVNLDGYVILFELMKRRVS
jgi:hypothetical protein